MTKKQLIHYARFFALSLGTALVFGAAIYTIMIPDQDREKAQAYMGNAEAQYIYAKRLASGDGVPEDDAAALAWFRKSAEQNDPRACMTMARLYFTGDGVEKNDAEGAKWLQRAAEHGSSFGAAMLGLLYSGGIGVTQDMKQALYWLDLSQELEADMMQHDLRRNMERIRKLPDEQREAAMDTFLARKKLYTAELFAKLMQKMQQKENGGNDGY